MPKSKSSKHVVHRADSRHYDVSFDLGTAPCEFCGYMRKEHGQKEHRTAQQVHHIETSFRGQRKHKEDGTDLLGVCAECHDAIHNKLGNGQEMKRLCRYLAQLAVATSSVALGGGRDPNEYHWECVKTLA